jgi:DNA replication protein DnaC
MTEEVKPHEGLDFEDVFREDKIDAEDELERIREEMEQGTFKPNPPAPYWRTVESPYHPDNPISAKTYDAIMFGIEPCFLCKGTGKIPVVQTWIEGGEDTGRRQTVNKPCPIEVKMKEKRDYLKRLLPSRYQQSNVLSLLPSSNSKMSRERQVRIIRFLRDNQNKGYFFYGAPGTGKTTYATALVRSALERTWNDHLEDRYGFNTYVDSFWIHYINWDTYIQSLLDYQNHPDDADAPTLSPNRIRKNKQLGRTSCVVIEEIDKSRLTEFKANKLFELICAIDETEGQIVITTNHRSKESFQAWLCKTDNQAINNTGEPVWRRIVDNCVGINCKAIE